MAEHTVLHVLPHPHGGGETYVDTLEAMDGFDFTRVHLGAGPRPSRSLAGGVRRALRAARGHDLVHVHGEVAAGLCLPILATRPSIVTLHGLQLVRRSSGIRRRVALANLRLVVRAARRTICVSPAERFEVDDALGVHGSRGLVFIPNGVTVPRPLTNAERERTRAQLGVDTAVAVALWVGSLDTPKQPHVPVGAALEAARAGVPVRLFLAGDGSLRRAVEDLARELPGAVTVLGFRKDSRELMGAADFFAFSSSREGMPFAVLEAMAAGLPVLATADRGTVDAIGDTGIAVAQGDARGFAEAFRRLATSPEERAVRGRGARERVTRHFSADEMVARTREVYRQVLEERG